jgi:hypothetical protein
VAPLGVNVAVAPIQIDGELMVITGNGVTEQVATKEFVQPDALVPKTV